MHPGIPGPPLILLVWPPKNPLYRSEKPKKSYAEVHGKYFLVSGTQ